MSRAARAAAVAAGAAATGQAPSRRVPEALRALLDTVRALTGDDAYERYLARHQSLHPELPALSPAAFYASETERRYGGVSRCC